MKKKMRNINPVAKHATRNKAATHANRKQQLKRGQTKHKGQSLDLYAFLKAFLSL